MDDTDILYLVRDLRRKVRDHEKWRTSRTLNLIPSENFASLETRSFLSTDLSNRYSASDRFYRGTRYADEIEVLSVNVAKKLFRCKFANVRPLSGHTCSLIVLMALLNPQDSIVTCPLKYGGYPGSSELGLGPLLHLRNLYFPYNPKAMNIVPSRTRTFIEAQNPEMTIFGSSFIPFPYKIRESLPVRYHGYKIYDGSHVMGLIAGKQFQDPLREGCSILMGSSHKSLFGPQGGLILSDDKEVYSKIANAIFPGIVDNIHWNRVAALTFSMIELLKYGNEYANQIILNSKALAQALYELGVHVKCKEVGYTESHQVLLDYSERQSVEIANMLEKLDIITDIGIRIGTSEMTRRGMKEKEMSIVAQILSDAINGNKTKESIRERVHKLVKEFSSLEFALSN